MENIKELKRNLNFYRKFTYDLKHFNLFLIEENKELKKENEELKKRVKNEKKLFD